MIVWKQQSIMSQAMTGITNYQTYTTGGFWEITPVLRTLFKRKHWEDTCWVSWGHIGPQAVAKTLWRLPWDSTVS
jgi:hypothetical protein